MKWCAIIGYLSQVNALQRHVYSGEIPMGFVHNDRPNVLVITGPTKLIERLRKRGLYFNCWKGREKMYPAFTTGNYQLLPLPENTFTEDL